ncbi:MAG: hypothetical protein AB8G99_27490, partial [Planctomycetaceae bacterium]
FETLCRSLGEARQSAFQLLHSAAATGGYIRFPKTVAEGAWNHRTETWDADDAVALLHMQAAIAARDGDTQRSVQAISTMLAFAKATQFEVASPAFFHHLRVYMRASHAITSSAPETWTDNNAEAIQHALENCDVDRSWQQVAPWYLCALNQLEVLNFYGISTQSTPESWVERYDHRWNAVTKILALSEQSRLHAFCYRPATSLVPNERGIANFARVETRRRCAIVILAMVRHRLQHGSFPETMEQIAADHFPNGRPADPWLEKQHIKFVSMPNRGYVIYGVGVDGIDNGGAIAPKSDGSPATDVGFEWLPIATDRAPN